jgi:hypothetical protein
MIEQPPKRMAEAITKPFWELHQLLNNSAAPSPVPEAWANTPWPRPTGGDVKLLETDVKLLETVAYL